MPPKRNHFFVLAVTFFVIPGSLFAQSLTHSELIGLVTDDGGRPKMGVVVTATSASLVGERQAITDQKGAFRLVFLPPGAYRVTFAFEGDHTEEKLLALPAGERRELNCVMIPNTTDCHTPVQRMTRLFNADAMGAVATFDSDQLAEIPSPNRSINDVSQYVPGVTGIRLDVRDGREGGLPNIRGGGMEGNQYVIDGLSARNPQDFSLALSQNFDSIDSLSIVSDPFSPEYGRLLGGAVNIVTKTGGDSFFGEAGFQYRDDSLSSSRKPVYTPYPTRGFEEQKAWANIGGYFIKERWWFFASYNRTEPTSESVGAMPLVLPAASLINLDGSPVNRDYVIAEYPGGRNRDETRQLFIKSTYRVSENQELACSYLDSDYDFATPSGVPATNPAGNTQARRWRASYNLFGKFGVLEVRAGAQESDFFDGSTTGLGVASRRIQDNGFQFANRSQFQNTQYERDDYSLKFTTFWDSNALGRHEISIGATYEENLFHQRTAYTGTDEIVFPEGWSNTFHDSATFRFEYLLDRSDPSNPLVVVDDNGAPILIPYSLIQHNNSASGIRSTGNGIFIQDSIALGNWTLMFGLRTDKVTLYDRQDRQTLQWRYGDYLSPRFSLIFDPGGDETHVFKLGYGLFKDTATIQLSRILNPPPADSNYYTFIRYYWRGATNRTFTETELHDPGNWAIDGTIADFGSSDYLVDPGLKPNQNERFLLEYNWRLSPVTAFTARFVSGTSDDLIEDVQRFNELEEPEFFFTNFEYKRRRFQALDLVLNGSVGKFLNYYLALTLADVKGTNPGNFENLSLNSSTQNNPYISAFGDGVPTNGTPFGDYWAAFFEGLGGIGIGDEGWYGSMSDSADTAVNVVANWSLPWKLDLMSRLQYIDGFHYSLKGYQPIYQDYYTFPEGRGARKTDAAYWLDLSLSRQFKLAGRHRVALRMDAFNLTDQQEVISVVEADSDLFEAPFARQNPRSFQFGIQYHY